MQRFQRFTSIPPFLIFLVARACFYIIHLNLKGVLMSTSVWVSHLKKFFELNIFLYSHYLLPPILKRCYNRGHSSPLNVQTSLKTRTCDPHPSITNKKSEEVINIRQRQDVGCTDSAESLCSETEQVSFTINLFVHNMSCNYQTLIK